MQSCFFPILALKMSKNGRKWPTRSLRGHTWFLTGVNGFFPVWNAVCMSAGSSVSILKSLASLQATISYVSPECPPRSLRGKAWFLTGVNGIFHIRNAVRMSPGSSVSILKTLASLEVPCLLGVSRASSKESKRTSLVPDWSQWCISRQECSIQVSRKLCINFEVSSFIRSTPSPRCLQSVLQGV